MQLAALNFSYVIYLLNFIMTLYIIQKLKTILSLNRERLQEFIIELACFLFDNERHYTYLSELFLICN